MDGAVCVPFNLSVAATEGLRVKSRHDIGEYPTYNTTSPSQLSVRH